MRVLYVQQYLGGKELLVMPIGLLYIATAASAHDAKLFDMNASPAPYEELEQIILDYDPQVVALSLRNIDNQQRLNLIYYYLDLTKTLQLIKRVQPETTLVLGGAGFSMFAETIMRRHREIDFGVYLEGERAFPALLDNLQTPQNVPNLYYREGEDLKITERGPLIDLKTLPIPRKDIIPDIKIYETGKGGIGINTKRGCPCRCSYCNYYFLNGLKVRMRDPVQIVDEIEELVKTYDVKEFMFADGIFSSPFEHVQKICHEIRQRKLSVQWDAWCDIKDINEKFLETVSAAGCRFVVISPDGYSKGALQGLNKRTTPSEIRQAVKLLARHPGIRVGFGFFLTTPGETFLGYLQTLLYHFTTVPLLVLRRKGGGGFSWVRIEPDTQIHQAAIQDGFIRKDTELLPEDIESLRKLFYIKPALRFLDPFSKMIVGGVRVIKNIIRPQRIKGK
ncbi:MAG: cobalamin-dependent protein [Candidatus Electrothrix sp. Rat3]|nr:cobalamin-dependent protein [Candidatus Electrothrix rattekaaiensis]